MEPIIPVLGVSVWFIVKIFVLFALLVFIVFSVVVVRQVNLMTETLKVGLETPLKIIALTHLILAILVFLFALIIL